MSDILCVTHRLLCREDFLLRLRRIAQARPRAILLREPDLSAADYEALARAVLPLCADADVPLVLNGHPQLAQALGLSAQLPFARRGELVRGGISIHTAQQAEALRGGNASWLLAGHIWNTDCKPGQPGRGTDFLRHVVRAAGDKPVFAIGGVTPTRMTELYAAGAAGACLMSALMTCDDPTAYLKQLNSVKRGIV